MNPSLLFDFRADKEKNSIQVKREFNAPLNLVWPAWTQAELLDQWWAPKPYVSKTKSMDFREGGSRLYAMVGPDSQAPHWCLAEYSQIHNEKSFHSHDAFCNEQGTINTDFPRSLWTIGFEAQGNSTLVDITIQYDSLADLEKIIGLGFKEGFTMALQNLDEVFSA